MGTSTSKHRNTFIQNRSLTRQINKYINNFSGQALTKQMKEPIEFNNATKPNKYHIRHLIKNLAISGLNSWGDFAKENDANLIESAFDKLSQLSDWSTLSDSVERRELCNEIAKEVFHNLSEPEDIDSLSLSLDKAFQEIIQKYPTGTLDPSYDELLVISTMIESCLHVRLNAYLDQHIEKLKSISPDLSMHSFVTELRKYIHTASALIQKKSQNEKLKSTNYKHTIENVWQDIMNILRS